MPYPSKPMRTKGAPTQKTYVANPVSVTISKLSSPILITTVLIMNPIKREIMPIIIKPAKSSMLNFLPLPSTIRFQGENQDLISWGIEKKLTINQRKFNQTWKISIKARE